jgi:GTPase
MKAFCFAELGNEGLTETDLELAISTLRRLAETLNAECVELRRRREHSGFLADFLIRVRADERDFIEVR